MASIFRRIYDWLLRLFWATEMDITMIGLQNAGKTSLLRVLAGGEFTVDSIPTVGFNMKRVQKGHVTLKCAKLVRAILLGCRIKYPVARISADHHRHSSWDLGGQPRFRSMWERYCRGVNAMVFIVDSADRDALPVAREELKLLLEKPALEGIPLLVLGNKSDLANKLSVDELIDALNLKAVSHREVSCYGISAKEETNLDAVLQWLIARASR
ncbi:ADP-ribosylation factor family protein [Paraphaeosphaeria minitans]|uniref:ADP-ribosylation factor family protein n=1 Tax=Paraphaeosphaeria minitans TaxID=565426 RepID=A0A9P6KNR1_9PLEO|nr:ADP-ribosylation factor family protein [Paraphaeosphaeria minitans]